MRLLYKCHREHAGYCHHPVYATCLKPETVQAMIIKTELIIADDVISIHILMLLEQDSLKLLADRIRLKTGVQENGNFRQDKQD